MFATSTICRGGLDVKVIAHEYIGVNGQLKLPRVVVEQVQEVTVISSVLEDRLPIIAPLDHMVRVAWKREPGKSGHLHLGTG